jgi:hypothetical protein
MESGMKNGDEQSCGWIGGKLLRQDPDVNAAAVRCRDALEKWEFATRVNTPTIASLHHALDEPLRELWGVATRTVDSLDASWLQSVQLELYRSLLNRELRPRGEIPWGDDIPGGCDRHLRLLDGVLSELAGTDVEDPSSLLTVMSRPKLSADDPLDDPYGTKKMQKQQSPKRRGYFAWNVAESKLMFRNFETTPFPAKLATPRKILKMLVALPSHRATLSELSEAFRNQGEQRSSRGFDPHLATIRKWLRRQPHLVWKAVDINRRGDSVQLVLKTSIIV